MIGFYYDFSLKIGLENEWNISLNFRSFIINFSLIWPRYSNFIFVSLFSQNWPIIINFIVNFEVPTQIHYFYFCPTFHQFSSNFVRIWSIIGHELVKNSWFWAQFDFNFKSVGYRSWIWVKSNFISILIKMGSISGKYCFKFNLISFCCNLILNWIWYELAILFDFEQILCHKAVKSRNYWTWTSRTGC